MNKGFTLIEILIVVGISALLLSLGVMSLYGFHSSQTVDNEARRLVSVLKSAQEKSIGQDGDSRWGVSFVVTPGSYSYSLFREIPFLETEFHDLKPALTMTITDIGSSVLFTKATGKPVPAGNIELSDGNPANTKTVTISPQGKIDYE